MKNKRIDLDKGIGELQFGLSVDDVKELLGDPDEEDSVDYEDGSDSIQLDYYELGLFLTFHSDSDYELTDIELDSDEYVLDNKIKVGTTKKELLQYLKEKGQGEPVIEDWSTDDDPNHELISVEEMDVNFWIDEDRISSIQFGPGCF